MEITSDNNIIRSFNSRFIHTGDENDKVSFIGILSYLGELLDSSGNKFRIDKINDPLKFRKWMKNNEIDPDPKLKEIKENSLHKYNVKDQGYYLFMYKDIGNIQKHDRNKRHTTSDIEGVYEDDDSIESEESDNQSIAQSVALVNNSINELKKMVLSSNESIFSLSQSVAEMKGATLVDSSKRNSAEASKMIGSMSNMGGRIERLHEKINPMSQNLSESAKAVTSIKQNLTPMVEDIHRQIGKALKESKALKEENSRLKLALSEKEETIESINKAVDFMYKNSDVFIKTIATNNNMTVSEVLVSLSERLGVI